MQNELVIQTPMGKLYARPTGSLDEYPGVSLEFEKNDGEVECLAVLEYDTAKEKMQAVLYADDVLADEPSHIVPYEFLRKE